MNNDFGLREGMSVFSADDEKLGRIVAVGPEQFQVEKGVFFPKEYIAGFEEVLEVRGDAVYLKHGKDSLMRPGASWTSRVWATDRFTETVGDQPLGALGRARMERTHDVIGAQRHALAPDVVPPLEPMDTVNLAGPPEALGRELGLRQFSEDEPDRRAGFVPPDDDRFKRS